MFSQTLKSATKTSHQDLEKMLIPQIRSMASKEDYIRLLKLFYTYFGGLERKIDQLIDTNILPDYGIRRKTEALENDLESLESDVPQVGDERELPEISDHIQALGALYVIEGSTLGGQIISKMIVQSLGESISNSLSFFRSYGEDTEAMWHSFQDVLNKLSLSATEQQRLINAANETFLRFKRLAQRTD